MATAPSYHRGISLRITAVCSLVVLVALAAFVVSNRSRVATQIDARKSAYATCAAGFRGARLAAARQQACGWRQLDQVARGDLIGLPFLALAIALTLVLVARIGHTSADAGMIKMGEPRADDPLI